MKLVMDHHHRRKASWHWILWSFTLLGCNAATHTPGTPETDSPDIVEPNLSTVSPVAIPLPLTDEQQRDGWIRLFDGETLYGWKSTGEVDWRVRDQTIIATEGEVGFLYTTTAFSDYVLHLQFRCGDTTNSGVFLHMPPRPQDPARDCYEVNIAPADNPFPTGSLVQRQRVDAPVLKDGWNNLEINVDGAEVRVKLNEVLVLHYHDENQHLLGRGHIGLQHNQGKIEFRDIRLKPLNIQNLFNGRDLTGWTIMPDMNSKFTVTPQGYLQVTGGKGQLESEGQFGDFILHVDCQTRAKGLNSGVFFRCIPGELWMGYESQIHHGFADGDRTQPADCGTGGIFRRQDARRVVADDLAWFSKTIIADGPHLAVWVNGYQVSDWTDKRQPHKNPRQGLRTEAGTIILQGHDPTTNLLFANLRISLLRQRPIPTAL